MLGLARDQVCLEADGAWQGGSGAAFSSQDHVCHEVVLAWHGLQESQANCIAILCGRLDAMTMVVYGKQFVWNLYAKDFLPERVDFGLPFEFQMKWYTDD